MRYRKSFSLLLLLIQLPVSSAFAQSYTSDENRLIKIGHDFFVETIPAEYIMTMTEAPEPELTWVVIPATYMTVTDTIIVQPAYTDIDIASPVYNSDGTLRTPARAKLQNIPEVTREHKRRVVKTPSRVIQRKVPYLFTPHTIRKQVKAKSYIVRNVAGAELRHFDNAGDLAAYLNSR